MALNFNQAVEEEKKKKLPFLSEVGNLMPGAQRGQETSKLIGEAYDKGGVMSAAGMGLRRAPGDLLVGAGDFINKGIIQPTNRILAAPINALADMGRTVLTGDVEPATEKTQLVPTVPTGQLFSPQKPISDPRETMRERNRFRTDTVSTLPIINETPNTQRDTELGKMNVRTEGDTTTYNIGENTLSYKLSDKDKQLKTNLERINQMIDSGIEVSPEQMNRINNLRQQAGYLRGGTDRQVASSNNRTGNLDVQFDSSVTPEARAAFLENPVAPIAQMDRYDKRQLAQIQAPDRDPKPIMPTNKTNQAMANYNQAMGEWSTRQIAREGQALNKDTNRINEMDTISQNKLRDIQGQVLQAPPAKENPLKPIVIEEVDPSDPTGTSKRQRIMVPNADGTGYINGMSDQPTPNAMPKLTPQQRIKAVEFAKANPNIDKATILRKIANGEI